EGIYGTREFVLFYLGSALLGGVLFTAWAFTLPPDVPRPLCLGASGAVTAVLVLYACHFPTRIIYLFLILPVPIWLFVVFQVGQDLLTLVGDREFRSPVAVVVHLAGAAFGLVYYKTQFRLGQLIPNFKAWTFQRSQPRVRVVRPDGEVAEEPIAVASSPAAAVDG